MIMRGVSSAEHANSPARKVLWILIIPEADMVCIINTGNRFFIVFVLQMIRFISLLSTLVLDVFLTYTE